MTPAAPSRLAEQVFQPAIEKAIGAHRLSSFVYHTTSSRAGDRTISVGGNAAGIARNAFGLMGAVSFLLETRGVGIGLDSYQRRVATHVIAISALLRSAASHADELQAANAAARAPRADAESIIVAHTSERTATLLPLLDPRTGEDKIAVIEMLDTRVVAITERRTRPAGYLISSERMAAIRPELDLFGARVCTFGRASDALVERYDILKRTTADSRAINPDRTLTVAVRAERATIPAGSTFVSLDQPAGVRLALALEPDTPGSLTAHVTHAEKGKLYISRLPVQSLTSEVAAAMTCDVPPIVAHSR